MGGFGGGILCPKCDRETIRYYIDVYGDNEVRNAIFSPSKDWDGRIETINNAPKLDYRDGKNEDGTPYFLVNCPECERELGCLRHSGV